MAPRYQPPTRVVTRQTPWLALVEQADPAWSRHKYREPYFLDGQGRQLYFNPYISGAYGRRTNVYPVGAAYGGLDPLITAALAPTVGNAIPGLYQAVATGSWA